MRSLAVFGSVREKSTRCKNKMLRTFGNDGETLTSLYLDTLRAIEYSGITTKEGGVGVCEEEVALWEACQRSGVRVLPRSLTSAISATSRNVELHFLEQIDAEYVMWINACLPFLKHSTIIRAARIFHGTYCEALTMVKKTQNWYWDPKTHKPVNNSDPKNLGTQYCPYLLESVHALHIFNRKRLLEDGQYWGYTSIDDPFLLTVEDSPELLDIDTEEDFKFCSALYKAGKR